MLLFSLLLLGTSLCAQGGKRDSTQIAIATYVSTVNDAANLFLNRQLSNAERLKAMASYPFIYEQKQVEQFKAVVLSKDENPEIRAMALNKIYQYVEKDEKLLNQVIQWFGSPETPKALRNETLNLISALSFSSLNGVLDVYNKMIEDPEPNFRSFAAAKLLMNGDDRAQQMLIRSLGNPQSKLFSDAQTIELLSLSPKKEYFPAVYKVLLETKEEDARLATVQVLGPYKAARKTLAAISQSANEKEVFRESALRALYSGDKENIVNYATPILQDKSASTRLQVIAINMTTDIRKSMSYRRSKKAQKADSFDLLVKNIYEKKGVNKAEELVPAANEYLLTVKPRF